ncbi:hypothetical protein E4T38_08041 [Aureobasidium subglaciale]|nr:hypothetical protein E4T38_08041 [Aureobasidium subglaciale]KAI5216209.1 hypothetical protein E4T40_08051 [Aureobasidium subglaciale]KAI5219436.1 hypothetical protein E4T41_07966 [Aureobasidium subglaciale]KAI5256914.1 hypothetical protein E4T46_07942 [Aureobasidium subglaciale]
MELEFAKTLGCVVLRGSHIIDIAQNSPSPSPQKPNTPYHITVFTKAELQELNKLGNDPKRKIEQLVLRPPSLELPIDLGIGTHGSVVFNVVFWPQGNDIRSQFDLPRKQFHITLSPDDNHDVDKGVNAITCCKTLTTEQVDTIIAACVTMAKRASDQDIALDMSFDVAWRLLSKLSSKAESSLLSSDYLELQPNSIAALLRAAHCCELPREAKKAMFMFAQAAHLMPDGRESTKLQCIEAVVRCSEYTEFGPCFLDHETEAWKRDRTLFSAYGEAFKDLKVRHLIQQHVSVSRSLADIESLMTIPSIASNQDMFMPRDGDLYRLPRFFRWLAPMRLAVMSTPRRREDVVALLALGITLIVTLTEEEPLPAEWFANRNCRNVFLPVRNYQAPTNEQVDTFIRHLDDLPPGEAALVHCGGGKGRAGTFAACYLMARGFGVANPDDEQPVRMFPGDAMKLLRHIRPGSIETAEQENFIRDYAQYLVSGREKIVALPTPSSESQDPLQLDGKLPKLPSLIVCCGLPGSGKSTFAAQLTKLGYTTISQDELGSRTACLNALSNALESGRKILVDRCNSYVEDREQWLAHAFHPDDALCVWFDVDPETCVRRADARMNHPTIAPGRAKRIVHSFDKILVPPSKKEKFACIARVPSKTAVSDLLSRLGVAASDISQKDVATTQASTVEIAQPTQFTLEKRFIYKFPRTRHLFNTGSASRDDLILTASDAEAFLNTSDLSTTITIEEKVDGANLGISLDSNGEFKVQNRSHYVNSKSHAQFKKLDKWLGDHYEDLSTVLNPTKSKSVRWILYGEWLFAKHSIHYSNLPDMFLAFDLFDTETSTFLSRDALSRRLEGTGIHQVNKLELEDLSEAALLELVQTHQSSYYAGVIEGVYLRRQRYGKTIDRAKIVRSDFIAGDEHWNRRGIVANVVAYE